jgi:DNA-binding CsgD family transcriptional regulator
VFWLGRDSAPAIFEMDCTGLRDQPLLDAIEAIYDAAPDPQKWPRALAAIADCFGDAGAIMIWRRDDGAFGTIVSPGLVEAQRDFEQNWATRDFKAVLGEQLGFFFNGEPFADRHLCSEEEIRAQPFFQDFLCRHGLGWCAGIAISPDPHIGVLLAVQRSAQTKPQHSDEELAIIRRIGRHAEKSLRLSLRLLDSEQANLGLSEALTRIGIGVFALDSLGRVVFQNAAASRLVGSRLAIVRQRLQIKSQPQDSSFSESIARALASGREEAIHDIKPLVINGASAPPLVIYFIPISKPTRLADQILPQTRAIVLAIEPKIGEPADPALVRDVLGITLGEARVAALIGAGVPPRETAQRLGIAEETARNLLKRVFSKAGVSRQSELAALLSRLVVHSSSPDAP